MTLESFRSRMLLIGVAAFFAVTGPVFTLGKGLSSEPTPSPAEVKEIGDRAIASQHRNDDALVRYERVERQIEYTGDDQPRTLSDKTYRVVPTGTGTLKLLLRTNETPVGESLYREELETWAKTLEMAVDPRNPKIQGALAKEAARRRERAEMVDAVRDAYITTWAGREMEDGYSCDKLRLDPNPDFKPHDLATGLLSHARLTIWIDRKSGQVVRGDANIISDISFGGGFLGKVYRGGHLMLKQRPVAPDVWLASYFQYDFSGRKLLFGFEDHQRVEIHDYRDLGAVPQALAIARDDISRVESFSGDP